MLNKREAEEGLRESKTNQDLMNSNRNQANLMRIITIYQVLNK